MAPKMITKKTKRIAKTLLNLESIFIHTNKAWRSNVATSLWFVAFVSKIPYDLDQFGLKGIF